MSKKILLIATSCILMFSFSKSVSAQIGTTLFSLPDSVCADHEFMPEVIGTFENYNWTFCPPDFSVPPAGANTGNIPTVNNASSISLAKDKGMAYSFILNQNGSLLKYTYENGFDADATETTPIATLPNAKAMYAVQSNGKWHVFVTENNVNGFRLTRYDFTNGLKSSPTEVDLGSIGDSITTTKELYIVQDGQNWKGFAFSQNDQFLRLDFGIDLLSTPTINNFGNINNQFSGANSITGIVEMNNWHLFVTNKTSQDIIHLTFGNTLENTPFAINLGTMGGRLKIPTGLAIAKTCDAYYGFVTNQGTSGLVLLKWENVSIAAPPVPVNYGNIAGFDQPISLSGLMEDSGTVHLFAGNTASNLSKMQFASCTVSSIPSSDMPNPTVAYSQPGLYTIFLTVNQGLPNEMNDCHQILVVPHPAITVSNDTLICQGDTLNLSILTYGADSLRWTPNYNIDTLGGPFVKVWPQHTERYIATAYYAPYCIVKTKIDVAVSEIRSDAGPDRTISDGSETILGGANTTRGNQYTYLWTPNVGITGSTGDPVTKAIPPSNLTYYLTVSNTDGCEVIDSVLVRTPCDKINLPNAFTPESSYTNSNTFGIANLQFAKVNYFKIFDRWGKEVFSTIDPNMKWDGRFQGKRVPMGVYVWEVDANCANTQERLRQSGTVTLIR